MFQLVKADWKWAEKNLERTCKEAFNAAYVELLSLPQCTLLHEHVKELISEGAPTPQGEEDKVVWRSQSTNKFKVLLGEFVRCLLLSIRTIFEDDLTSASTFSNVAAFMQTFQNVYSDPVAPEEPIFLKQQTLEGVIHETVFRVAENYAGSNDDDHIIEREELETLIRKYCRHTTTLLILLDVVKELNSGIEIFRAILCLLSSMVEFKKQEYEVGTQQGGDSDDDDDDDDKGEAC
jgi:hypothetical protein